MLATILLWKRQFVSSQTRKTAKTKCWWWTTTEPSLLNLLRTNILPYDCLTLAKNTLSKLHRKANKETDTV